MLRRYRVYAEDNGYCGYTLVFLHNLNDKKTSATFIRLQTKLNLVELLGYERDLVKLGYDVDHLKKSMVSPMWRWETSMSYQSMIKAIKP